MSSGLRRVPIWSLIALLATAAARPVAPLSREGDPAASALAQHLKTTYNVAVDPAEPWRSLEELSCVATTLERVARALGGPERIRALLPTPVRIRRVSAPIIRAFAPIVGSQLLGDVVLPDYNFDHGPAYACHLIAHELGHVLDWRSHPRYSQYLAERIGARLCAATVFDSRCSFDANAALEPPPGDSAQPYAARSREEYWAEVFAAYAYPDYYALNPQNRLVGPQTALILRGLLAASAGCNEENLTAGDCWSPTRALPMAEE